MRGSFAAGLVLALLSLTASGCSLGGVVGDLKRLGATVETVKRIRVIASDEDPARIEYSLYDDAAHARLWRALRRAEPVSTWNPAGFRTVELWEGKWYQAPLARLQVSPSDLVFVLDAGRWRIDERTGATVGVYRCPGLYRLVTEALAKREAELAEEAQAAAKAAEAAAKEAEAAKEAPSEGDGGGGGEGEGETEEKKSEEGAES